jgi:hypothetical protein
LRLTQGVADTVAEAVLASADGKPENASELFAAAAARDAKWVTLRGPGDAAVASLELPADAVARIRQDLAAGYAVVVPAKAPAPGAVGRGAVAWWRVDPASGQTLGVGHQGWGSAATEYIWKVRVLLKTALFIKCVAKPSDKISLGGVALCGGIFLIGSIAIMWGGTVGAVLAGVTDVMSLFK